MTSGTQDRLAARERALREIYAEVLGIGRVGPDDGFFDVGGDSVLALQVVARAREAGLGLSVRDLFDYQSAAGLAPVVTDAGGDAEGPAAAAPVALSPDQLGDLGDLSEFEDEFTDDGADAGEQRWDDQTGWETGR